MVLDKLLTFAADNYGFDKNTLNFISDSSNQIYSFQKNGDEFIIRFSERPTEQTRQTKAEMDWLYYLAQNNVNVSLPLATDNNQLVISTEIDGKSYIISAFEILAGRFWNKTDPALWNAGIFYNWGKVMGDIHRLTKAYSAANDSDIRDVFTGYEALHMDNIKHCSTVYKITMDLIDEIMSLPKDADSYGLIHYDLHPWNFIIDGMNINVFDFDDSLYGWFALDIGIALYHGLWWGRKNDAERDFTNEIIESFINGYILANPIADFWLKKIPLFMKFRQICKFSWFFNPSDIDEHQKERINNIENGMLFTGFKLNQLLL